MADEKTPRRKQGCGLSSLCGNVFHRHSHKVPRRPSTAPGAHVANRIGAKHAPFTVVRRSVGPEQAPLIGSRDPPAKLERPLSSATPQTRTQVKVQPQKRRPLEPVPTISMELESMLYDHQRSKESSTLIRASSGNFMLLENLGNLRGRNAAKKTPSSDKTSHDNVGVGVDGALGSSSCAKEPATGSGTNVMEPVPVTTVIPDPSNRLVPEELNQMGSLEYKNGRLPEALAFFEQATTVAPERALYWNNRAVVLTSLGRLLDAITCCSEAVKVDPSYCRAHRRLAILYLRLGEPEKSMYHHKHAGAESRNRDISGARSLQSHLTKCSEARKRKDWQSMLKQAQLAASAGADSSPKVFASQAEALLRLLRHQEAEAALVDSPTFDIDESTKFFGPVVNAYILAVQAQVAMAFGRFDAAASIAQRASWIDPRNTEHAALARRVNAVSMARKKANDLLKESKFAEACAAYEEGLDQDPHNSVLLCNRAACRCKLGQWEAAVADCSVALSLRPSYKEARLRRADCYAQLEKLEDSIQDYKYLVQLSPRDEVALSALREAQDKVRSRDGKGEERTPCPTTIVQNATDQVSRSPT